MTAIAPRIFVPTAYLPPIFYMYHLVHVNKVLIEKKENYQKQSFRNRCEIYGANGILALSIPVKKVKGNHTPVDEVIVSADEPWQAKQWRAIESAYNASPFFMHYRDELEEFIMGASGSLFDLNYKLLTKLLELIGMQKEILFTSDFQGDIPESEDFRNNFSPKNENTAYTFAPYTQVFSGKFGFKANLSIIDLLFNEGPATLDYLRHGVIFK
ncbi:MAG: WbqC family protein [Bacteroidota bacterium]|nr:WbqC family protein [Bacteroidota bacterium]